MSTKQRLEDAVRGLLNYGDPYCDELVQIVERMAAINYNLCHGLHQSAIAADIIHLRNIVDNLEDKVLTK